MVDCVVVQYDRTAGDALMTLPTICGLAQQYDRIFLEMHNRAVLEIADFPPNVYAAWGCPSQGADFKALGAAAAIEWGFKPDMLPTILCFMRFAGLEVPAEVPRPKIITEVQPGWNLVQYDVVLAPWAGSEVNLAKERSLTVDEVYRLVEALNPLKVCVVGRDPNPKLDLADVDYKYDLSFARVAHIMRTANVVVTVDSFPSRLAHAAGVKNHIVLDSGATPIQCQVYPGAMSMRFSPGMLDAKDLADKIFGLIDA